MDLHALAAGGFLLSSFAPHKTRETQVSRMETRCLFSARCLRQLVLYALSTMFCAVPLRGADDAKDVQSIADLRIEGLKALEKQDRGAAIDAADRLLQHHPNDPRAIRLVGDLYLRSGKVNSAITQYERYVELVPVDKPELWQYGVALALADRFDEGRQLFEMHRIVNPNDVENAAWHFLCVAKLAGIAEARKLVLPAPSDSRVPMNEIRRLLIDGNEERVWSAVNQLPEDAAGHKEASFYANLYLGLLADAQKNPTKAKRLVGAAAKTEQVNFMADIARVYLTEIEAEK